MFPFLMSGADFNDAGAEKAVETLIKAEKFIVTLESLRRRGEAKIHRGRAAGTPIGIPLAVVSVDQSSVDDLLTYRGREISRYELVLGVPNELVGERRQQFQRRFEDEKVTEWQFQAAHNSYLLGFDSAGRDATYCIMFAVPGKVSDEPAYSSDSIREFLRKKNHPDKFVAPKRLDGKLLAEVARGLDMSSKRGVIAAATGPFYARNSVVISDNEGLVDAAVYRLSQSAFSELEVVCADFGEDELEAVLPRHAVVGDIQIDGTIYHIGNSPQPHVADSAVGRILRYWLYHIGEPVSLETIAEISFARNPRGAVFILGRQMLGSDYFRISHVGDRESGMYALHRIKE